MLDFLPQDIHPVATMLSFSEISKRPDTGAMLTSNDISPIKLKNNDKNNPKQQYVIYNSFFTGI